MVEDNGGTLRTVAWSEVCPWLNLFRTFRLAIGFRVLLLSAVAFLLTTTGWWFFGWVFGPQSTEWIGPYNKCPWVAITEMIPDQASLPAIPMLRRADGSPPPPSPLDRARQLSRAAGEAQGPMFGSWELLSRPMMKALSDRGVGRRGLACLLLCGLWTLAVWAFFGGVITRIVAVQLACDERITWTAAIRHAGSKWLGYFATPLFPLGGIVLAGLPIFVLGLLLRASVNWGALLVALVWPLALLGGLLMALLLLGLIFGWPLMWATISAEGTDSFDALSRSYAYVFQRPLHYLFYVVVAALFGALSWLLVSKFAAAVVGLSYWAASWGSTQDRMDLIIHSDAVLRSTGTAGRYLIHFWNGCIKLLAVGFLFSYFWTAATAIYFLLRRDVDATEMDEVFHEEETSEGLPPLAADAAGAPVAAQGAGQPGTDAGAKAPDEE